MDFRSDNTSACAPEIMNAVLRANAGPAGAYGADALSGRLDAPFSLLLERPVQVLAYVKNGR